MEEEEAAVNKREGTGRKAQRIIAMIYDSDEGTNMSDESHEKGRKMSMGPSSKTLRHQKITH